MFVTCVFIETRLGAACTTPRDMICAAAVVCAALAALLAAYTYDVRSKKYTRLMTVQESPLGTAYRNLTGLSSTTAAATTTASSTNSSSNVRASLPHKVASAAASEQQQHQPSPRRLAGGGQQQQQQHKHQHSLQLQGKNKAAGAAFQQPPPDAAVTLSVVSGPAVSTTAARCAAAATSQHNSPRMLGYAVPLQPILPTDALLAATADCNMQGMGGVGSSGVGCGVTATGLTFHISVLSRFPFSLKELAATAAVEEKDQADSSEAAAAAVLCGSAAGAGGVQDSSGCVVADSSPQGTVCLLTSQPPSTLAARPDIPSLGAYLETTKLQQVRLLHVTGWRLN